MVRVSTHVTDDCRAEPCRADSRRASRAAVSSGVGLSYRYAPHVCMKVTGPTGGALRQKVDSFIYYSTLPQRSALYRLQSTHTVRTLKAERALDSSPSLLPLASAATVGIPRLHPPPVSESTTTIMCRMLYIGIIIVRIMALPSVVAGRS